MKSFALVLLFVAAAYAETIVKGENVTAFLGEDAQIPCKYTPKSDESFLDSSEDAVPKFEWYHGNQRLFYAKGEEKYPDTGASRIIDGDRLDVDSATGTLTITKVTIEDNDNIPTLKCKVSFGKDGTDNPEEMNFLVAQLQSANPTTWLEKMDGPYNTDLDGNVIIGTCQTTFTYPGPDIDFYKNGKMLKVGGSLADFFDAPQCEDDSTGTIRCKKDLSKVVEASDHQAEFICSATVEYMGMKQVRNSTFKRFNVTHDTTTATLETKSKFAFAGEEMTLTCKANGFPAPIIEIEGERRSSYTFVVTKEMNGNEITCSARNQEDALPVTASYTLNVLSVPEPAIMGDKEVVVDEPVTVTCTADGDGAPTVAWFKGDTKISDDGNLHFDKATFENSGTYQCKAANIHEELERVADFKLDVKGIKLDGDAEEQLPGKKGDTVTLNCVVESNPRAAISWNIPNTEGVPTIEDGYKYRSEVDVGPLEEDHSEKVYTCTGLNEDGQKVTKTYKMPQLGDSTTVAQEEITAGSSSAAIIISILVIILIVAIILAVLYNKGIICKKQEKGEESAEGDIAVEINNDDGDVEAGNGKPTGDDQPANEEEKLMNGEDRQD